MSGMTMPRPARSHSAQRSWPSAERTWSEYSGDPGAIDSPHRAQVVPSDGAAPRSVPIRASDVESGPYHYTGVDAWKGSTMTQPPDDQDRRPDATGPDDAVAPEDQPTIAWTPPEPASGEVPPGEVPLTEATPTQPAPLDVPAPTPTEATPPDAAPPDATAPPASPIISASPAVPPDPADPAAPAAAAAAAGAAPLVGWEAPPPASAAPGREGYVIAGMGARLVAYFIDSLIVSIIPTVLTLLVVDYSGMMQQAIDAAEAGGTPGQTSFVMAVTPELILVTLISVAIQFLYFVGFWTSGSRATPGMRGLRMQVVDAATGAGLSLVQATKRFIALGAPLALLILIPALQSAAGIAQFALSLFLFFTAITNDRRQGLHDKWANSLVIRSTTSGDGAVVIGCLVLIVISVGLAIILSFAVFAAMAPQIEELLREMEQVS